MARPYRWSGGSRWLAAAVVVAAALLVGLIGSGTWLAVRAERSQAELRIAGEAANQALAFGREVQRQLLALDQSLDLIETQWERDPDRFDLANWERQLGALDGSVPQIVITDETGRVVASNEPQALGRDLGDEDFFRFQATAPAGGQGAFMGPLERAPAGDEWQITLSRRLSRADGRFAGIVALSSTTRALRRYFAEADLGPDGLVALIGTDGVVRAMAGPRAVDPGADFSGTRLVAALRRAHGPGRWIGPTPPDGRARIIAFRPVGGDNLPVGGINLDVVIGLDAAQALQPTESWARQAQVFGGLICLLIVLMAGGILRALHRARRREASLQHDRSVLAAANLELAAARARADLKSALLETTVAGMSDGVAVVDPELELLEWNGRFAEYFDAPGIALRVGLPFAELFRAQLSARGLDAEAEHAELDRQLAALAPGALSATAELVCHDGRTIELRHRALPGGGFVTLAADITTRKETEAALRRAREAAEQAMEAKSAFVAIVSHEIRTPLNTLIGGLSLLAGSELGSEQRGLAEMTQQAGNALLGLIDDVLEMTRLEAGRLTLRPVSFALKPLLDSAVEMFAPSAAARGLRCAIELAPDAPAFLQADPGRVRQVLLNLMSNAVKFSDPGEVVLAVGTAKLPCGSPALRLAVRDPGPAIPANERDGLFQPFTRLQTAGRGAPGSGLGLSICRRLAQLMGGQIGHSPLAGGGNEFWLLLPLAAAAGAAESPATPPPLGRCRILLVEDVGASQHITALLLRRQGHEVQAVSSGAAAVAAAAEGGLDAVLLDLMMPGMSGFEAAAAIRALPGGAGRVPIIALTASTAEADRERCRAVGMNSVLSKPASVAELLSELASCVRPASGTSTAQSEALGDGRSEVAGAAGGPALSRAAAASSIQTTAHRGDAGSARSVLNLAHLRRLAEGLSLPTAVQILHEAVHDLGRRQDELGAAGVDRDWSRLGAAAHAMASIAANCGFVRLEERLRAIIAAARRGGGPDVSPERLDLELEIGAIETALRTWLAPAAA